MTPVRRIGILGAQTTVGGVLIHHRVHIAGRDGKVQARAAEFLEIAEIAVPVGLWDDSHAIACGLERASDDSIGKGRMVNIGIG